MCGVDLKTHAKLDFVSKLGTVKWVCRKFGKWAVSELITTLSLWCLSRYLSSNATEQTFMPQLLVHASFIAAFPHFLTLKRLSTGHDATMRQIWQKISPVCYRIRTQLILSTLGVNSLVAIQPTPAKSKVSNSVSFRSLPNGFSGTSANFGISFARQLQRH